MLFISCSTFGSKHKYEDITEEEAAQALEVALYTASSNAGTEFYRQISQDSFLPEEYQKMTEFKDVIPGFSVMMETWREYAEEYIYNNLEEFYTFIESRVENMTFEDPIYYVESSNTSITTAFSALNYSSMVDFWRECFEDLEIWGARDILNQYTNWIVSKDQINGTNTELINSVDMREFLSVHMTELYLDLLATEEELFRTTPDPYGNEVARKVFRTY
ncbi:MAG: hypothetical protein K6F82_01455 [Sphaerochaetaceae bacterium]|nr:hypothetical protein [Sphaerochaetaceae bacterium]